MLNIHTILHPTDFSEQSEAAFEFACTLAGECGAKLVVVHVVEEPLLVGMEAVMVPLPGIDLKALRERLETLRPRDADIAVRHHLLQGNIASELLMLADKTNADMIVIGTHGRTGLGRLLMGSVAEQVLRRASCPVVCVKAAARTEEEVQDVGCAVGMSCGNVTW